MERTLVLLLITFTCMFGLTACVGIISVKFEWDIEDECFGLSIISLILMLCVGLIGAVLFGDKG